MKLFYALMIVAVLGFSSCAWLAPKEQGGGGGGDFISEAAKALPFPWNVIGMGIGTGCTIGGGLVLKKRGDTALKGIGALATAIAKKGSPELEAECRFQSDLAGTEAVVKPVVRKIKTKLGIVVPKL